MQVQPVVGTDATCTSMSLTRLKRGGGGELRRPERDFLNATAYWERELRWGCECCALALGSTCLVSVVPCQGQW